MEVFSYNNLNLIIANRADGLKVLIDILKCI